jgi:hypothetical protein
MSGVKGMIKKENILDSIWKYIYRFRARTNHNSQKLINIQLSK